MTAALLIALAVTVSAAAILRAIRLTRERTHNARHDERRAAMALGYLGPRQIGVAPIQFPDVRPATVSPAAAVPAPATAAAPTSTAGRE